MNNYTMFEQKNILTIIKYLFHISNILLIIFYLYPGSIFGYLIYGDLARQYQITEDILFISSNRFMVLG